MNIIDSEKRYKDVLEYHFSPILKYFNEDSITDIEVNPDGRIFAHHIDGHLEELQSYLPPESIEAVATLLASTGQNDVNNDHPSVAAIWPDPPYRIHIIIPPAVEHAAMVIRRFSPRIFSISDMIEMGVCTKADADRMIGLIRDRRNIVVSGETGSGKTTLLNTLISEIPENDRLYIVEDTKELQCEKVKNRVFILTGDKYTARAAIKDALRFRPDRIIVGEVRDGAALDLLEAWNTGHPGGLCSIHANSPETVKLRLRSLIQQVSMSAQQDLIDETVDAVVQISLCHDGKRRITEIKEFNR